MKITIVGAGEIGRHLATRLSIEAHEITVIESDERLAGDLDREIDAKVICGNGASVNTMIDAGVPESGLVFAVTSDNNTNLVCSKMAKQLGAGKAICRVHPGVQREEWLFDHRGAFEIDHLFSSERLSAVELAKYIRNPESLLVEEIARGRIEVQQVQVSSMGEGAGKTLIDLRLPPRLRVAMVSRGDRHFVPAPADVLETGDILTIFGEARKVSELANKLGRGIHATDAIRVVIFGGGEYGFALAQMLQGWNCTVRILERDPARCEEIASMLSNTTVINIDGTKVSELREERVGAADFFVAASHGDEDNVMTCLQAHSLGASVKCLTLVHRADYADAISESGEAFGVEAAVSPREATRKDLMRFVTDDRYHVLMELDAGEIIEATVPENSKIANRPVSEIQFPEGSGLVGHIHGIHAHVPAADDVIKPGDNVFVMVSTKAKRKFLKLLGR